MRTKPWAAAALAVPMALAFSSPAAADEETVVVLESIGDGDEAGTADLVLTEDGQALDVRLDAEGLEPEVPFAPFLAVGGEGICPPEAVESGAEAEAFVGAPILALTTEGDVTPELVVDVDRVPVVTTEGNLTFERTFDITGIDPVDLEEVVLVGYAVTDPDVPLDEVAPVLCGEVVDVATTTPAGTEGEATPTEDGEATPTPTEDGEATPTQNGEATPTQGGEATPTEDGGESPMPTEGDDGSATPTPTPTPMPTEDGEAIPAPAPAPAAGGQVEQLPAGGVPAGAGSTSGVEHASLFALGGAGLVGAGALALRLRRSTSSTS